MSTFETIFQKHHYNLPDVVRKSQTWFQQQARLLNRSHIVPDRLIKSSPQHNVNRIIPGELYLFAYDAKHQDTLAHWDMYPMVFPFRRLNDGFIGLNMHYLPYQMRVRLLDSLLEHRNNKTLNEMTRLKYSWSTIERSSQLRIARPCVHRYLLNHVQSPLKRIDATDWATAMMLPVEQFVGASKQQVWAESMKKAYR